MRKQVPPGYCLRCGQSQQEVRYSQQHHRPSVPCLERSKHRFDDWSNGMLQKYRVLPSLWDQNRRTPLSEVLLLRKSTCPPGHHRRANLRPPVTEQERIWFAHLESACVICDTPLEEEQVAA